MALWTLKDITILVVDDFPEMRSMMRSMLLPFGANKLTEVRSGDEAVEAMTKQTMQIVLCDYSLGDGKDGQQVLEEAKERNLLPYSSIFILVTAENTSNMVMGAFEYQPDDYLIKPFTKTVLQARLAKLQERKQGLHEIARALDEKRFHAAIELCNAQIAAGSKNTLELTKLKGELLQRIGDFDGAKRLYEKTLEIRDFSWARFGLGQTYFHLKLYAQARTTFEDLININNKYVLAYDWLAKVHKALGDNKSTQEALADAIKISPKAILRQKALAEVALENSDLVTAEQSFKHVVREGKNSVHRSPSDFGGLAKVYLKKAVPGEAEKVIVAMTNEFQKTGGAVLLQSAVIQSLVYKETGKTAESEKALDQVMSLFAQNPSNLPTSTALELAEACLALGKSQQGNDLLKHVIRNNHEDTKMLEKVTAMCVASGQAGLADLVETTRQEVVGTNNKGVELVKQGKLEESIDLFLQAARAMPENITINLNAALSLIAQMQKNGVNNKAAQQTEAFLARVMRVAPANERYQKVLLSYRELTDKTTKAKTVAPAKVP
ncbi:MAG: response regulator [Gammaproteobacteria bacterium]|nr:response regulator [Gammaproteobacteria bacterium]